MDSEELPLMNSSLAKVFDSYEFDSEQRIKIADFFRKREFQQFKQSRILGRSEVYYLDLWRKLQQAQQILFTRFAVAEGSEKKVAAVVIGGCGNGKTSLMNNLCGSHYDTGESLHSKTQGITSETVLYIQNGKFFLLFDTPGTTTEKEVSLHAKLIYASLTYKPLNVIFVNLKYERRGSDIVSQMQNQIHCLKQEGNKVVFLVSHSDIAESLEQMMPQIYAQMDSRNLKQQVVFYSNKRCFPVLLARTLFRIASNYPLAPVNLEEEEFYQHFNVTTLDKKFVEEEKSFTKEMNYLTELARRYVQKQQFNEQRGRMIIDLGMWLRTQLEMKLEQFRQATKERMLEHDYFGPYFNIQKVLLDCNENFAALTRPYLMNELVPAAQGQSSIIDLIKQCPNCERIWLRVQACPKTTCGTRPTDFWDWSKETKYHYQVTRVGDQLVMTKIRDSFEDNRTYPQSSLEENVSFGRKLAELKEEYNILKAGFGVSERFFGEVRSITGLGCPRDIERIHQVKLEMSELEEKLKCSDLRRVFKNVGCGFKLDFDKLPRIPDIASKLEEWFCVNNVNEIDIRHLCHETIAEKQEKVDKTVRMNIVKMEFEMQRFSS